jgi:hypothetical protein
VTRRTFIRTAILCALVALSCSPEAYAADESTVKVQGKIMAVDAKKNTMIVNERVFVWDLKTTVHNEKGSPMRIDRFTEKTHVYIVGDQDGEDKRVLIRRIYLLPKRVEKKDRHHYPFMQ